MTSARCITSLIQTRRYNDGVKIKAQDFQVSAYLRVSDHVTAPYAEAVLP